MEIKLKNVITINDFDYSQGGASKVAIDTANLVAESGINSIFFSAVHGNSSDLNKNIKQVTLKEDEVKHNKSLMRNIINKDCENELYHLLKNYSPDDTVIHIHGWTKACSSVVFSVAKMLGFKTILTVHEYFALCPNGAFFNYKKNNVCKYKPLSRRCILCNCDSRNYIVKLYRILREKRYYYDIDLTYVYLIFISAFEKEYFMKNITNKRNIDVDKNYLLTNPFTTFNYDKRKKKKYDFIFVGRSDKEKGAELFINLALAMPSKSFVFVGTCSEEYSVENLKITGWVSENEVNHYLENSYCLIFPSLWPETFGLNAIKAIASGMNCLVSSNTAPAIYIKDKRFVFKQGDFVDLLSKAKQIISTSSTNVQNNCVVASQKDYIDGLLSIYDSILRNNDCDR